MLHDVRLRRIGLGLIALVTFVIVGLGPEVVSGQVPYDYARRKASISLDIKSSLAPARRGYQLLQEGGSEEDIRRGIAAVWDSYKHLRLAQEHSEALQSDLKFPDPLMALRSSRILWIRDRLRFCRDNDPHLVNRTPDVTAQCLEGLGEALRRLEILVATED
jgi:hypothetical protein